MDSRKSGPLDNAAAAIELAWQAAASNLQLLAMLDVVHDWGRSDAISVGDAAEQTETLAAFMGSLHMTAGQAEVDRIRKTLEAVVLRAERLARLAPAQARDDASGAAMAKALQRLADGSEDLRRSLVVTEPSEPDAAGEEGDAPA